MGRSPGGGPSNPADPWTTQNQVWDDYGTIAGGGQNRAGSDDGDPIPGRYATVGGGEENTANGHHSTVPGGLFNVAGGDYSLAAGRFAKVRTPLQAGDADGDSGTFVWADATGAAFKSTGDNQFLIRAGGGVGIGRDNPAHPLHIGTDATNGNGAYLTAVGIWTNGSDRNSKHNFEPLDKTAILTKVLELPITKWQYKGEADAIRHIGPVAQDFYGAFGLGSSDKHIGTLDAEGVALAAIQGLHEIVQEKDAEIADLEARLGALEKLVTLAITGQEGGVR